MADHLVSGNLLITNEASSVFVLLNQYKATTEQGSCSASIFYDFAILV